MEKDVKLGSVGDVDVKLEGGVASAQVSASEADGALKEGVVVSGDLGALVDKIKAYVESKSPAALQPAEELAFGLVKSLVVGLK